MSVLKRCCFIAEAEILANTQTVQLNSILDNSGPLDLIVPESSNVLIRNIRTQCFYVGDLNGNINWPANNQAGSPYYTIRFLIKSNNSFLRQKRGAAIPTIGVISPLTNVIGIEDIEYVTSDKNNELLRLDVEGSGIFVTQLGVLVQAFPQNQKLRFLITLEYQNIEIC